MRLRAATRTVDESAESGPRRRFPSLEIELDASGDEVGSDLPTIRRFAGYEILGRIAVGGMAEVFLARERGQAQSARHVALKVVRPQLAADPEFAEMFLREGKVALGVRHPNICHVYRFGMEHGHPFLAMELVHGVSLHELHARARRAGGALTPEIAVKIAANVAEALHSAHVARDERGNALGIVHQDVSPHNVMVAYDGTVKLLDFGVASTSSERAIEAAEVSQTMIRGKAGYLSPEQCTGGGIDGRSDVFALGIVLYEMLTGERLFARKKSIDSIRAIASEPLPDWPASISPALARVLERALARDRNNRYPSAAAMQDELERSLADSRISVTSSKIADELARLLGKDYGRAPELETAREVADWLRSPDAVATVEPAPRTNTRAVAIGALGMLALALVALGALALGGRVGGTSTPDASVPRVTSHPAQDVAAQPPAPRVAPIAAPVLGASIVPAPAANASPPASGRAAQPAPRTRARTATPTDARTRPVRTRARPRTVVEAPHSDFVDDPGF